MNQKNKICSVCKNKKTEKDFYKSASSRDGFQGRCKDCQYQASSKWEFNNLQKRKIDNKNWRNNNKDKAAADRKLRGVKNHQKEAAQNAAWYRANMDHKKTTARNSQLKRDFGITLEEFDKMLENQGGRCANPGCRTDTPGGRGTFHTDHMHVEGWGEMTGAQRKKLIRGLLCHHCNLMFGNAKDDKDKLRGGIEYLEAFAMKKKGESDDK